MKTTLELPAELIWRTKAAAELRGQSMRAFVSEALERHVKQPDGAWKKVVGKARRLDLAPVKQAISSEFSRVDEHSW